MVEAINCADCNSSVEWHGKLPEDPNDWICADCHSDRQDAEIADLRAKLAAVAARVERVCSMEASTAKMRENTSSRRTQQSAIHRAEADMALKLKTSILQALEEGPLETLFRKVGGGR
jgi:formate-dependent nitrite reductase cytochrome c552 subunit